MLRSALPLLLFLVTTTLTAQFSVRQAEASSRVGLWSDAEGKWSVDPLFDSIERSAPGGRPTAFYIVRASGVEGLYDPARSRWVLPIQYRSIEDRHSIPGAYVIRNGQGRYGMVDTSGTELVPFKHERLRRADDGNWLGEYRGRTTTYSATGEQLTPWQWLEPVEVRGRTYYRSREGGLTGLFNAAGEIVLDHEYTYIGTFQEGWRVKKHNGRMGLLNDDFSIRVPFTFTDIQSISTGTDTARDYLLLGRRSPRAGYAIISEDGTPEGNFVLSFNEDLRIYKDAVIDVPRPGKIYLRDRRGEPVVAETFNQVRPFPVLSYAGIPVLRVRQTGNPGYALANIKKGAVVTPFKYTSIERVEPVVAPRTYLPLIEGMTKEGIELLRPDGRRLSDWTFAGVEDYNNWKSFREYFELGPDPTAEAFAWTADLRVFVVHSDDRVVYVGTYKGG